MAKAIKDILKESEHTAIQTALDESKNDADTLATYSTMACFGVYPGGDKGECPRAGECLDKKPEDAAINIVKCMRERGYKYKVDPASEAVEDEESEPGEVEAPPGFEEKPKEPEAPEGVESDGKAKDAILSIMNADDPIHTGERLGDDDDKNETVTVIQELLSTKNMRQKSNLNSNHVTTFSEVDMANMYQAMAEGSINITSLIYTSSINERKISENGIGGDRIINALRALGGLEPLIPMQKINGLMVQK
jgi:hypothetical protein